MSINHKSFRMMSALLLGLAVSCAGAQEASRSSAIDKAQRQITDYLSNLANLHCTESVIQQKLTANGHVETTERAKYDYLIMMNGSGDDFQLNESRIESAADHHKHTPTPMLVTNGVATVLLVFHPYYRDSFTFEVGPDEVVDGKPAVPVRFTHIPGRRTPAALALRDREYPLELQGTAWLDKQSGEVVKIDADLLHDMSDVGLRSMNIRVDYKPADPAKTALAMTLPSMAVVDVATPRQHWRNTHVFDSYKSFATGAEQDPNVKIHPDPVTNDSNDAASINSPSPKE